MPIILKFQIVVSIPNETKHVSIDPDGRIWAHEAAPKNVNRIGNWSSDGWQHEAKLISAYPIWKRTVQEIRDADHYQVDLATVDITDN